MISENINRLDTTTRQQLQTLTEKDKLVISIDKTDPEIMKQVVIFLYTAKCQINERNGKTYFYIFIPQKLIFQPMNFSMQLVDMISKVLRSTPVDVSSISLRQNHIILPLH